MKWKVLAGFRFFLAAIVVCSHLKYFTTGNSGLLLLGDLSSFAAVLGFLLISGYSIQHSVAKQPEGFYQRRILRLYPLYVLSIAISFVPFFLDGTVIQSSGSLPVTFYMGRVREVVGSLFFLQGFVTTPVGSNAVLWTLSVEVFCYLLAPIFLKMSDRALLSLIGISAIAFAAYPTLEAQFGVPYYSHMLFGLGSLMLLWAWLLGFLYARTQGDRTSLKILMIALGVGLTLINGFGLITSPITYALSALVLIYAPAIQLPNGILNRLNYLGEISYPLYLFHFPVFIFANAVLNLTGQFILVGLSLAVSMFFYHTVDVPLRFRAAKRAST